jgi:hypothetical protein
VRWTASSTKSTDAQKGHPSSGVASAIGSAPPALISVPDRGNRGRRLPGTIPPPASGGAAQLERLLVPPSPGTSELTRRSTVEQSKSQAPRPFPQCTSTLRTA